MAKTTTDIATLKINYLSQAAYDAEVSGGTVNANEIYLTPAATIPTKTSDLSNDSGFITCESDPVFTASAAYGISSSDITDWGNSYNGKISLDTTAQSGTTDGDLYAAIVALGWGSDVIE